ncbi:MAG: CvpA family protein [Pseudomonadota bacterium]
MIETVTSSFTAFDFITVLVILMSALMALSRGFMRELATMAALIAAIAAAFFGRGLLRGHIAGFLPEGLAEWWTDLIIVGVAFVAVYVIVRFAGSRVTSLIQGTEGVSIVDRLAGFIFGAARGGAALVFLAWLMITAVPDTRVPPFISESASYPLFEQAAASLNAGAPIVAGDIDEALGGGNTSDAFFDRSSGALDTVRDDEE